MKYVVMAGCEYPARPAVTSPNAICDNDADAQAEAKRRNQIERAAGHTKGEVLWFVAKF